MPVNADKLLELADRLQQSSFPIWSVILWKIRVFQ
jgi:hypothetical protein